MGIVNRRNAFLGWTAWTVAKRVLKRKARAAVPGKVEDSRRPNKSAIISLLAAAGGALWFWRKKTNDESPPSE